MCKGYYSPKIKEDYIPHLYYLARYLGIPMTHLVNKIVGGVVKSLKDKEITKAFDAIKAEDEKVAEISNYLNSLIRSRSRQTRSELMKFFKEAKKGGVHDCFKREGRAEEPGGCS